jgi:methyltransferase (TIGR00027 family)
MSDTSTGKVQITADALIYSRTHSPLARRLAVDCPYDRLFLTEAGVELAKMALALDPVYEQFNLVRFAWFAERMTDHASRYAQMVILGSGYDTRSLTLPALQDGGCRVFEVDLPDVLAVKQRVLAEHGVLLPATVHFVPCDLNADDLRNRLAAEGFDTRAPAAVFMEGVFFFLRGDRAAALLDPASMGLARGSALTFDAWTARRVETLNTRLIHKTGRPLFGDPALGDSAGDAEAAMRRLGYGDVRITTLDEISRRFGVDEIADPIADSWLVIDARVA